MLLISLSGGGRKPRHCGLPWFDPLRFLKSFRDTNTAVVEGSPITVVSRGSILFGFSKSLETPISCENVAGNWK
ncbi:hypothetical protein RHMOL_Rhmol05G0286300 [Rhododendron molle]|uniref:Uncharacterized protein n=1 Tax=Rhododendron molle TaxID=49168 RepID=A0ACC0NU57_RHOML|nr:hypothetical protein RHMOL_Rhmol05G0286300 [Rhododendron molle]